MRKKDKQSQHTAPQNQQLTFKIIQKTWEMNLVISRLTKRQH